MLDDRDALIVIEKPLDNVRNRINIDASRFVALKQSFVGLVVIHETSSAELFTN